MHIKAMGRVLMNTTAIKTPPKRVRACAHAHTHTYTQQYTIANNSKDGVFNPDWVTLGKSLALFAH